MARLVEESPRANARGRLMRRLHVDARVRGFVSGPARRGYPQEGSPPRSLEMFVYILASKTRAIYVGVTNDLVRRVWERRSGAVAGFTRRYGVDRLVYYEACPDPAGAISREKQIKGWARVKKVAMIESLNSAWNDLAEHWFVDVSLDDPLHALGVTTTSPP
jgi:putative endonuclease